MRAPSGLGLRRRGMTIVELLVLVACIVILMGLLIPAIETSGRRSARSNECSTKLNNLAKAVIMYEMQHGQLPGYVNDFGSYAGERDPSAPDLVGATYRSGDKKLGSWVVALLPYLDAQPTYEVWAEQRYPLLKTFNGVTTFTENAAPNLAILQCPNSTMFHSEQGRNCYIANAGMYHLTATRSPLVISRKNADDSSRQLAVSFADSMHKANGVFNNKYEHATNVADYPTGPALKIDDLKDGAGNTMLFSESLQAISWHQLDPDPAAAVKLLQPATPGREVAYPEYSRYTQGMVWLYEDPDGVNGAPKVPDERRQIINSVPRKADLHSLTMNHENAAIIARPSSAHADGFNASFADGSSRFISDTIVYRVYQAMLTPRGKSSLVPDPSFTPSADGM